MNIKINTLLNRLNAALCLTILTFSISTNAEQLNISQRHIKKFEIIQQYFDEKEFDQAIITIKKIEKDSYLNNVEKAYIHHYRGSINVENKRHQQAAKEFQKVLDNSEGVNEFFIKLVRRSLFDINKIIISKSNSKSKITELKKKINSTLLKKERADLYSEIGKNYYNLNDYSKASDFFSRVVKLSDGASSTEYLSSANLILFSNSLHQSGEKLKALNIHEELYKKDKLVTERDLATLGKLYFENEDFLKASEYLENAISQNLIFEDWNNTHLLSKSYLHSQQKNKAINYSEQTYKKLNDKRSLLLLSEIYFEFEEWKKAESTNLKLIKSFRSETYDALSWYRIGVSRYHLGNFRGTKKALNKALKKADNSNTWLVNAQELLNEVK